MPEYLGPKFPRKDAGPEMAFTGISVFVEEKVDVHILLHRPEHDHSFENATLRFETTFTHSQYT